MKRFTEASRDLKQYMSTYILGEDKGGSDPIREDYRSKTIHEHIYTWERDRNGNIRNQCFYKV